MSGVMSMPLPSLDGDPCAIWGEHGAGQAGDVKRHGMSVM